jgi:alpha-tubulin suppressor-like RCC1 family protein
LKNNFFIFFIENGDLYGWGENRSGKLTLKDTQNLNQPKLLQILKGKSINHIALGVECSIISTSDFERSIVFRETQPKL